MEDSTAFVLVPLSRGMFAKVSPEDVERVLAFKWSYVTPYAGRTTSLKAEGRRTTVRLHQFILPVEIGEWVDHINRDKLDCRRENLRACLPSENSRNRSFPEGSSGLLGVTWFKSKKCWTAQISIKNKHISLGYYVDKTDAACAYDSVVAYYYADYGETNFSNPTPMSIEQVRRTNAEARKKIRSDTTAERARLKKENK